VQSTTGSKRPPILVPAPRTVSRANLAPPPESKTDHFDLDSDSITFAQTHESHEVLKISGGHRLSGPMHVFGEGAQALQALGKGETMNERIGLFEALYTNRAIRRFRPDPIPDSVISKIIEAATQAPNGSNQQRWRFLVSRDPGVRRRIGTSIGAPWTSLSPSRRWQRTQTRSGDESWRQYGIWPST
jgi:hypothetical protein